MASSWIARRSTKDGATRYRVMFRIGGRESAPRYAGTFPTMREAKSRRDWVAGELANMRVPELDKLAGAPAARTLREAADRWRASRRDVTEGTRVLHRVALDRVLPVLGEKRVDAITTADVTDLVTALAETGRKRETIRKSVKYLAAVLEEEGVDPNPARGKRIRLPHEERAEIQPPSAEHVEAVHRLLASDYRLPLLVLDGTGMRVGELERLTWGDMDEPRGRWRVSRTVAKTGHGRWVNVPPVLFAAVLELCPRDDRHPDRRVFERVTADRLRTAINRACTAAGVPGFSPHDLRHRRISLLHLSGVPWATIGQNVGQRDLAVTANTYTHVLTDETELDYGAAVSRT